MHQYDRDHDFWTTENGVDILIKDISDSHLVNILNWMIDRYPDYNDDLFNFMVNEAEYRRLLCFTAGNPYPVQNADGRYELSE